ncbi:ankyrin repeat, SAM and basic leucine zipper domain-containing protein 1 [Sitodiplosis mosellana]|uniref:ankyrin repeat, SAM and basic leucine zipper domain-containing protein 1 n=1 Tax=Sitodiplosis mosellana TaxID=263140 RepID=UPI002444C689|nr:ankyrin repeat, SAM and basic leucine zipper domain-containing protein 1 [Sitodiplosis mosellana]XP_055320231.1 ankyrin repeat, SAM and basic leucine zipper domain-containing protein 1 [Sitodiplosis mosellana]
MTMSPRPPEFYDSDSDFSDGSLIFDNEIDEDGRRIRNHGYVPLIRQADDTPTRLFDAICKGDVDEFRSIWQAKHLDVNEPIHTYNWTPLMLACQERQLDLVKYLLFDLDADPNANSNDMTALILACCGKINLYGDDAENATEEESKLLQICEWLIQRQAMVNKINLRRETPLMYAAAHGFVSVIQLLLNNRAILEACDNDGRTALFYAVNDNRYDATKILIEAGALIDAEDVFHNTPKRLAMEKGFDDIVALFPPDPVIECVPISFHSYQTYKDLIPTAFPEKEIPPYSPDIYTMLHGMRAEEVEYKFYKSFVGLPEFLTITDERLREIGIEFPYQRKRILLGLLRFHDKAWSRNAMPVPKMEANIQQYFEIYSNCLKQMIVIRAALKFVEQHDLFVDIEDSTDESLVLRKQINQELAILRRNALQLLQTMQKIEATLAVTPPLNICQSVIGILLKKNTFRQQLYHKFKTFAGIGLIGIAAAAAVIKLRLR